MTEQQVAPGLTVVIPCRNARATLGEQLAALSAQRTAFSWEVIVIDDRSTDGSADLARSFAERLPQLRVLVNQRHRGAASSRNQGARCARGRALLFLDADDVVGPGYLQAMGEGLAERVLVCPVLDFSSLNDPRELAGSPRPMPSRPYRMFGFLPHAGAGGLGVRRDVFLELGGFDESIRWLHDADLCWRARLALGHELHVVDEAVLLLRLRQGLLALYRQGVSNGCDGMVLRREYADYGIPWTTWSRHLRQWRTTAEELTRLRRPEGRRAFAWRLGKQVGRLQGMLAKE
ncbi:glycosyltransferase family 2 protein [Streptomyces sp. NBC_00829]|uniref:glycosyltransferase family 2 protein n=1 Tax=Streptomyces sp. NBC_00829 TaxID=2903679 RepID=UPI00386BCA75|nr:glycosyltransferase family 2 protein [Streptomyces sp. NBC_00829]